MKVGLLGTPGEIRTHDLLLRRQDAEPVFTEKQPHFQGLVLS